MSYERVGQSKAPCKQNTKEFCPCWSCSYFGHPWKPRYGTMALCLISLIWSFILLARYYIMLLFLDELMRYDGFGFCISISTCNGSTWLLVAEQLQLIKVEWLAWSWLEIAFLPHRMPCFFPVLANNLVINAFLCSMMTETSKLKPGPNKVVAAWGLQHAVIKSNE